MSYGVYHRCDSDPTFLWLWHRLAATVPIALAWELPYVMGEDLKDKKAKETKNKTVVK